MVRQQMFQAPTLSWDHRRRTRQVAGELCQAILIFVGSGDFADYYTDRWWQRRE
jgi:hypothetical protein